METTKTKDGRLLVSGRIGQNELEAAKTSSEAWEAIPQREWLDVAWCRFGWSGSHAH
ncbi:hypothetical protein [Klebsiella pneumoniae]|uniref:hypothetical protein n=1 Tax=Klebsiella pneumoniae TaxID=573 RepID=UPI003D4DC37B